MQQEPPPYQPAQNPGYPPQDAYPPQQSAGYPPPQQSAGYPPPQQSAGYPPPQQSAGYPPPQQSAGYPPPQQQQAATTVVVTQPTVTVQQPVFREVPVNVIDSNGQQVTTQLQYRSGALTWVVCCLICWLTGCWCIALIPFCIDATKDIYHITPTDGKVVGVYKRM